MTLGRRVQRWVYANLVAFDVQTCSLFGGRPYETWSARCGIWRDRRAPWGTIVANAIDWGARTFFGQMHHCADARDTFLAHERAEGIDA